MQMLAGCRERASEVQNVLWRSSNAGPSPSSHQPSICDILVVKIMLQRRTGLPLEIINVIIDEAAYWARSQTHFMGEKGRGLTASSHGGHGNRFVLRTPPLGFRRPPVRGDATSQRKYTNEEPTPIPAEIAARGGDCSAEDIRGWLPAGQAPLLEHPCRRIVFTFVSRDQGWASHRHENDEFKGSYSWFDVGLERYGWQGERAEPVSANLESDTETETSTKTETSTAPSVPVAPESAVLYTVCPSVVAAPVAPAALDNTSSRPPSDQPPQNWQFDFPLNPGNDRLQSNSVASAIYTEYKVAWSWDDEKPPLLEEVLEEGSTAAAGDDPPSRCPLELAGRGSDTGDGSFVRNLRVGDVVTVWAKARYPGWSNTVRKMRVDVYWAV
ncbi:MAG: hypothetical protein SEPTF4163_005643 [Sporothrix epigloea]